MIATTRPLTTTTISFANLTCRWIQIKYFSRELQIHMKKSSRNLLLGNLRKSASVPEALYATYLNVLEAKSTSEEFKKTIMEPFLKMWAVKSDTSSNYSGASNPTEPVSPNSIQNVNAEVTNFSQKNPVEVQRQQYKDARKWKITSKGLPSINSEIDFILRILSYNILAQDLLESHCYLYRSHRREALEWNLRKLLVQAEILESKANVICIQEMQQEHLNEFIEPFCKNGFKYLYKKRTNNMRDGLLMLYRFDQFQLEDHEFVEYRQTSSDILNRNNVGMVVKFSLVQHPETFVVISTTHLLYNPNRSDVRLAQTQILFAEIERIAFIENSANGPKYHPIILCGDFNLQPNTGVYQFITEGSFRFAGKNSSLLESGFRRLSNSLTPPALLITDNCQHLNVLMKRLRGIGNNKVMLKCSEPKVNLEINRDVSKNHDVSNDDACINHIDTNSTDYQKVEIVDDQYATFSSGSLTHPFKFKSVYKHVNYKGEEEATTHQDEWVTVDYIFYSDVEPINQYVLPTISECKMISSIPNFVVGSDHFCLGATFKLSKKLSTR